ncbi:short-chain dehydrogenase/reductase (SDR family member), putative [Babesia caballi]|uniref:Short-chain dehydrogenase/reductase (SDR family member), putative n=1 Tax=Babesia caballi TaxID=5871 RepID=A0AAV4LM50_BABCB|nr:short-chain dehydrogenase/reductase (SDR family member), putative [Babesia caballi]
MIRCAARRLAAGNGRLLTEHGGWKVQLALCVDRQPTEYAESARERAYREFAEAWGQATRNQLKVPRVATIESKITHKIVPSKERKVAKSDSEAESWVDATGELDALLASEIALVPTRRRVKRGGQEAKQVEKVNVDGDVRNVERLARKWLFLAVKHRQEGWKLPTTDLYHGDGLRETLQRICAEQLGEAYAPYFVGYAPFFYRTVPFQGVGGHSDVRGNKRGALRVRVFGRPLLPCGSLRHVLRARPHDRAVLCRLRRGGGRKALGAHQGAAHCRRRVDEAGLRHPGGRGLLLAVRVRLALRGVGGAARLLAAGVYGPERADCGGDRWVLRAASGHTGSGGSSGIGRETALQLLLWKCKVVITGRDKTRGANAIEYLRKNARVGFDMIQYVEMDLNDPKSIKRAADEILRTNSSIDFLINNAGVAGSPTINAHKKESMFATNFLGHFHLTKLLTSALVRDRARIINVSSIAHYHYDPSGDPLFSGGKSTQLPPQTSAKVYYGRSKLFNMWHAQALQRRFDKLPDEAKGVACFSCGPGIVSTPLLERYSSLVLPSVVYAVIRCFTKRPKDGANTLLYLCSAPMQQLTPGAYYYECRLGYVSKHAQDVAKQEALYAVADKMTGIVDFRRDAGAAGQVERLRARRPVGPKQAVDAHAHAYPLLLAGRIDEEGLLVESEKGDGEGLGEHAQGPAGDLGRPEEPKQLAGHVGIGQLQPQLLLDEPAVVA